MTSPAALPRVGAASPADVDRCPGMLRPHQAADGAVVRIRLIGGRLTTSALRAVGTAAERHGDGTVTLTSRGNLQLRGLAVDEHGDADPALVAAVATAGLLPSRSHERVRNVLVSPLTGISGGRADLRPAAHTLDEMLCADEQLADLSGRFLFGLDDGRGDLADQTVDLGVAAIDPATARVRIGPWWGSRIPLADAPAALIAYARRFLDLPGTPWRITDLDQRGLELLPPDQPVEPVRSQTPARSVGAIRRDDGGSAFVVGVPLGRLDPAQLDTLLRVTESGIRQGGSHSAASLVVTPDRSAVIPHVGPDAAARLATAGFIVEPADDRRWVTSCVGAPGCARADGPTAPVAGHEALREGRATGLPVHVIACERRCGSPAASHLELLVTRAGLRRHLRPTGARTR